MNFLLFERNLFSSICFWRISYDYLPNNLTKTQYGNLGDIALVLKLVEEKV
jgi:hypothetical protein